MEFRVLGPVEFWSRKKRCDLGWARERHILAILLMTPGKPVSAESFIRKVWDENPPPKARDRLYSHIARLRARLHDTGEDVRLRYGSGAYFLETDPENIDYHRFRTLRSQARSITESGDINHAFRLYRDASRLWRGEPLAGLSGSWAIQNRQKLESELLGGTVERIELELLHGRHTDLVAELHDLTNRFPFDEKLVELLMQVLYRGGRQAEALVTYRQARTRIFRDLGTEPGPGLRTLHQRILQGDPALLPESPVSARGDPPPNNLPRDLTTFTGRVPELDRLTGELVRRDAATVLAIDGMAGVGKTVLAVHLAHRLADHYPDGLLYLHLHGHDAQHAPMDATGALGQLLRMLGILASLIPSGLDERATMWRAELARRRVLIVLDDATSHDQISHLLPGTPGCLVMITSRRGLAGLDDVRSLSLEVLPPEDGATLFSRAVGSRRMLQADDVASVVRLCGYLPLAIHLAGSRFRHRPAWSVADLVGLLEEPDRRLAEIRAGNRKIITAFELSFHCLDEGQQQAFWRLGLHPGADITAESAAALLDFSQVDAEKFLDDLLDHHLIAEPRRGRYRFHDLIGEYARLLSGREPERRRAEVLQRLLDYYLFAADAADRLLYPYLARGPIEVSRPLNLRSGAGTEDQARAWMTAELDNLLIVARYAADNGWTRYAALLAHVIGRHLDTWGRWPEGAELHARAVTVWRETGDRAWTARALADLSMARWRTGHHDEALRLADEALVIQGALNDQRAVADLLDHSGLVYWHRSDFSAALGCLERALHLRRVIADRHGQGGTLNYIAFIHWHRGDYAEAAARQREALALYQEDGDRRGQQMTLNNIGETEIRLGNYATALSHYEEAASLHPHMGPQKEAIWLNNVATAYQGLGRHAEALEYYRKALRGYRDIGDRRCEADVLNNIGSCHARMGRDGEALIHHQNALRISVEISERYQESQALHGIGGVHRRANRHEAALSHYERVLDLTRAIEDVSQEARTLDDMGTTLARIGEKTRAEEHWRRALDLYEALGAAEAEAVRIRLAGQEDVLAGQEDVAHS
ncbi:tetratricopeptide repeat protein [Streptosporangium sp. NBC_01755]|uniref:AfsR/SARP family transcriptional regulator n=1 Tax=unclassified Streptosporangium TaxID=2632669 RepID=UPI002DD986A1|nr:MULTISPECIES: tetratricopeptide repeat protein [unclassified Streptosporangium]WSA25689.1 tetratricopeptide repeat protein [Streptosporangium sp. NBC_01810]WSD02921.1 tetratricopeptide repeat protein [Streptosporangium sp. NBC_01755]